MEQEEKQLSEHESLSIIQQMIDTAKQEQKDDGMGWIIWGWMLFAASVLTYLNLEYNWFESTFVFWNAFGLLTMLLFVIQIIQAIIKKKVRVKTYTKAIFEKLNVGFFISLFFIIVAINLGAVSPAKGFSMLISLYAFWILIYGALLDFKPSIIGALISWIIAFIALFQNSFSVVMLLQAAAVLCGYIIPGHIANNKFKKLSRRSSNSATGV
jgi:hypothetical protein